MLPILDLLWTRPQLEHRRTIPPEVRQRCHAYLDQITQAFGVEFTDDLTNAIGVEQDARVEAAYEQGFLTAFHLWMDVYTKYSLKG